MARLTVEDCEPFVPNRFELVIMAATRSRDILDGAPISVDRDGDKVSVVSLREIAAQSIALDTVEELAIRQFQNQRNLSEIDKADDENDAESAVSEIDSDLLPSAGEFSSLEEQSLESGFDSVSEILDEDLEEETEGTD